MTRKLVSPKSIERVILISPGGEARTLYKKKGGKGRQSLPLKPFEKAQKTAVEAVKEGADAYLGNHKRSNKKKKDGWAKDLADNTWKANARVMRKVRKSVPK